MERRGNKKGNEYYEAALPAISPDKRSKPQDQDSPLVKEKYIKEKYQLKLFTAENLEELLAVPSPQSGSSDDPPVVSQDVFDILDKAKEHSEEMTDLEKLLQDRFDEYEAAMKEQKERRKREAWNREQIALVKEQAKELSRLNAVKAILERSKAIGNERGEKVIEERRRDLEERRERIERRKERLAESEKRRWEAVRRAAQRDRDKELAKKSLLGRDVGENPYSRGTARGEDGQSA
jgi:NACalpha-BTF3-like transcription factor